MSTQQSSGATPPEPAAGDPEALKADIERTRAELGQTVEALVAKADVKARAQRKAAELTTRAVSQAKDVQEGVAGKAAAAATAVRAKAQVAQQRAASQLRGTAVRLSQDRVGGPAAARSVSTAVTAPQAAGKAAAAALRTYRVQVTATAVVLAVLAGWLAVRALRR